MKRECGVCERERERKRDAKKVETRWYRKKKVLERDEHEDVAYASRIHKYDGVISPMGVYTGERAKEREREREKEELY